MVQLFPMKTFAFAALLLSSSIAYARPQSSISLGPVLSIPEIAGAQASFWADDDVSVDFRVTLSSVEGGLTGHIPLASGNGQRHDILFTGMGGFVHRGVRVGSYSDHTYGTGGRVIGMVGYGLTHGILDLRLTGGLSAYDAGRAGWALDPTFVAYLGFFI